MYNVCVIMSTYNGENYLSEQIETIFGQKDVNVELFVRDDSSSDKTIDILEEYSKKYNLHYYSSNNLGPALSFLEAINNCPKADYYALSDQDDIWEDNKLISAINMIKNEDNDCPILYCSATKLVDENGIEFGYSKRNYKNYKFLEGTTVNPTGCTVVFNNMLMNLLRIFTPPRVNMHDSWMAMLCLATSGKILYDSNSFIKYRQHTNNVMGGKKSVFASIKRRIKYLHKLKRHTFKNMLGYLIDNYKEFIEPTMFKRIIKIYNYDKNFFKYLSVVFDFKFYRGTFKEMLERRFFILFLKY